MFIRSDSKQRDVLNRENMDFPVESYSFLPGSRAILDLSYRSRLRNSNYTTGQQSILLNGGLNQMMLRCLFLRGCCVTCGMYSSLWLKFLCPSAF